MTTFWTPSAAGRADAAENIIVKIVEFDTVSISGEPPE